MKKLKPFKISQAYKMLVIMIGMLFISQSYSLACCDENDDNEEMKYILVWDCDGGCISFPVDEMPRFEYDFKDSLVRCVTNTQTIDIPLKDVHKYTLDTKPGMPTDIDKVSVENGDMLYANNSIYLTNFVPGSEVYVCTADGILISHLKTNDEGYLSIYTNTWKTGIYVIKANNVTYKIYKK